MTRRIQAKVYAANGTTLVDTLESDNKRTFLKDLSAEGSYGLQIKIGHADEDAVTDGRIIRFLVDGTARWQGLVETRDVVYADPDNRQAGRVIGVQGRGTLALLERAVVRPELGLGRISPRTRYMHPASADFDDTAWPAAVELYRQDDPVNGYGPLNPDAFPDSTAYWIWDATGDTPPVDPGFVWFRTTFTIDAGFGGDYQFAMSADDGYTFFLDGELVGAEARAGLWGVTRKYTQTLDEGDHVIAVKAENFDRPNPLTNAAGFILSGARVLAGGATVDVPLVHTDASWKMLAYPATEPGMTVGQILDIFLNEAQANGDLPGLTWDFDAVEDSDGTDWPVEPDESFPVSMHLLDVVRHFVDEHLCDVEMSATGLVLHAYVSKGDDLSGTVAALYGENLNRLAFKKTPPGPNVTLSMTAEGRWVERENTSAASSWGRRVVGLSLASAPSADAANRQVDAFFDDNSEPVEAITDMQLEEVTVVPFDDFDVGDVITATSTDGGTADCRVTGLRLAEDGAGNPIWSPDLVRS